MSIEKILQIDLLVPGNADEISIKYPIINKQWIARGNDYYVYVRTNNSTRTDIPAFDDVKGDPWNRSFKDWRYAYAQPGEEFDKPHEWTCISYDTQHGLASSPYEGNHFYRYVTVEGKFVKLHMIIER